MSSLQRIIQQETRSRSRNGSRSHSVQSSRHGSRSSSRLGSRLTSDDEDEYTSNAFLSSTLDADELIDSLDGLLIEDSGKDKFSDSLEVLNTDQRKTSLEAREKALLTILSVLTIKYDPSRVDEYAFSQFTKAHRTARSDLERMLALQCIVIATATDPELAGEYVTQSLPKILESLSDENISSNVRANYAFAYALLQFFMFFGSGAYGAEELVQNLIETADGFTADEGSVASATLLAAGLVASTMANISPAVDDNVMFLIDMLDKPSPEVRIAAGKVLAMFYQLYNYEDENGETLDSIPFVDHEEVLYKLRTLLAESSKKVTKRDKREQKSLFRDVLKTVTAYQTKESREAISSDDVTITHIKLSRSKAIQIDSWNKLILVQMYKWLYGPGVHTQMVANPYVSETIEEAGLTLERDAEFARDTEDVDYLDVPSTERKSRLHTNEVTRQKQIKARRQQKIQQQLDAVGM